MATDGAVNNNSPSHANTHPCTKTTPSAIPLHVSPLQTPTVIEVWRGGGLKIDDKCVNGCVILWRSDPGGVRITLVLQPLNSINTLPRWSITHPPMYTAVLVTT